MTDRCVESRLLLTPRSKEEVQTLLMCLCLASEAAPGIQILGFVQMTNHTHAVLRDTDGNSLSKFMQVFKSQTAKRFNKLLERSGPFWHRRYSGQEILDAAALRSRMAYLIANPVAARQVDSWKDWGGLQLWAKDKPIIKRFRSFDAKGYNQAREAAKKFGGPKPKKSDFVTVRKFTVHPMNDAAGDLPLGTAFLAPKMTPAKDILHRVNLLQQKAKEDQRWCKGMAAVRNENPYKRPEKTKRSPRPLCLSTCIILYTAFAKAMMALRDAYLKASKAFRSGNLTTPFPEWTYRPPGHTITAEQ